MAWTHLILPQYDITRRTLICVYIIEEVAHAHAQNAPLEWFSSIPWLRVVSTVQALERHLLVAYPVIHICGFTEQDFLDCFILSTIKLILV